MQGFGARHRDAFGHVQLSAFISLRQMLEGPAHRHGVSGRSVVALWQLLKGPRVAIGIRKAGHPNPTSEILYLVNDDSAPDQQVASCIDIADNEVHTADDPRCCGEARQALCEDDRARGATRGELDDTDTLRWCHVVVDSKAHLLDVEARRTINVRHRNWNQLESHVHDRKLGAATESSGRMRVAA